MAVGWVASVKRCRTHSLQSGYTHVSTARADFGSVGPNLKPCKPAREQQLELLRSYLGLPARPERPLPLRVL